MNLSYVVSQTFKNITLPFPQKTQIHLYCTYRLAFYNTLLITYHCVLSIYVLKNTYVLPCHTPPSLSSPPPTNLSAFSFSLTLTYSLPQFSSLLFLTNNETYLPKPPSVSPKIGPACFHQIRPCTYIHSLPSFDLYYIQKHFYQFHPTSHTVHHLFSFFCHEFSTMCASSQYTCIYPPCIQFITISHFENRNRHHSIHPNFIPTEWLTSIIYMIKFSSLKKLKILFIFMNKLNCHKRCFWWQPFWGINWEV